MEQKAKREAILLAASEQFKQYGYRKTSMDDIAKRMGVSRASLYSYFKNKDDIFRSVSLAIHHRALSRAQHHLINQPTGVWALYGDGSRNKAGGIQITLIDIRNLVTRFTGYTPFLSLSHGT